MRYDLNEPLSQYVDFLLRESDNLKLTLDNHSSNVERFRKFCDESEPGIFCFPKNLKLAGADVGLKASEARHMADRPRPGGPLKDLAGSLSRTAIAAARSSNDPELKTNIKESRLTFYTMLESASRADVVYRTIAPDSVLDEAKHKAFLEAVSAFNSVYDKLQNEAGHLMDSIPIFEETDANASSHLGNPLAPCSDIQQPAYENESDSRDFSQESRTVPLIEFNSWNEVAIGIGDDGFYYLFKPQPDDGQRVAKSRGVKIQFKQQQLKKLLEVIADSDDGIQAPKKEVIIQFGYAKKGELPETTEDLRDISQVEQVEKKLTRAVNDCSRKLRDALGTTTRSGPFSSAEPGDITSKVRVRYVIPDKEHHFKFQRK